MVEPEAQKPPPIPEGDRLCETCGHAETCAVRVAISAVAPEGGIEVGACGFYLPVSEEEQPAKS